MPFVTYEYYQKNFGGKLEEKIFNDLETKACDVIELYIVSLIPFEKVKSLEEYEFDIKKCICYQIDCLSIIGLDSLNGGNSDNDITKISVEGFEYSYAKKQLDNINGITISPMAPMYIKRNLSKLGYFNKLANA